eukprot:scaffold30_cov255-Pinguiococcus_pyrenoidosus.AAC.9
MPGFTYQPNSSDLSAAPRKIATTYSAGATRWTFSALVVLCLSYVTAFMETLTIAGFPYYAFENR